DPNIQRPVGDRRDRTQMRNFALISNQSEPSRKESTKIPSIALTATFAGTGAPGHVGKQSQWGGSSNPCLHRYGKDAARRTDTSLHQCVASSSEHVTMPRKVTKVKWLGERASAVNGETCRLTFSGGCRG
ncbi:hypothetical protein KUCAC02_003665, partial [Chaenocephalus aceratus]